MAFDATFFDFVHSLSGQSNILDWFGVFFAQYMPIIFIGLVLYFLIREGTWRKKAERFIILVFTLVFSYGIFGGILHFFINRNRPFIDLEFSPLITETGNTFPSRHSLVLFSIAMLIFSFNKRAGLWFFFFALLNGVARVFVGIHWPSDIIAGAVIGIISYFIAIAFTKQYFKKEPILKQTVEEVIEGREKDEKTT